MIHTNTNSNSISLPDYTLSEELISSISHGIGTILSISACVLCIIKAAFDYSKVGAIGIVSAAIFGLTMIILYCMSTLYHALKPGIAKKVFRVIDHCSVFLLIAGTYTPYTLVSLKGALGWTVFGIIWGLTAIGITFNAINVDRYQKVSAIINLAMGWLIIFTAGKLLPSIGALGLRLLLIGGIIYSVGALLYSIGSKVRYFHSIFHFFVLGGSIMFFFSIYLTVL